MKKQKLLERAQALLDDRRYYQKNYHAVNVKRYNDLIDEKKIARMIDSEFKDDILEAINDSEEYYFWLNTEWDQLNYELTDLHNIFNKDDKYYHEPFQFITLPVYSMGRSGGWACFNSELEQIVDNIDDYELEDLEKCIEEVEFVIDFIDNYNKNLSYQDYVENNIDCIIERVEHKKYNEMKVAVLPFIFSKNEAIKRHANGILKEVERLSL